MARFTMQAGFKDAEDPNKDNIVDIMICGFEAASRDVQHYSANGSCSVESTLTQKSILNELVDAIQHGSCDGTVRFLRFDDVEEWLKILSGVEIEVIRRGQGLHFSAKPLKVLKQTTFELRGEEIPVENVYHEKREV